MKHEPKKHFDISKPHQHGPDPTSKPIIVGHHPMMPDPMIREERKKAAKPINVTSADEPESVDVTPVEKPMAEPDKPEPKPDKIPDLADISAPHEASPALTPSPELKPEPEALQPAAVPESAPGAVFSPAEPIAAIHPPLPPVTPTQPTQPEPPAGEELHIPAGHATVHHKPRIWVWAVVVLVVLVWAYAAVDALTDTKLPLEFFKKSEPVTQQPTITAPSTQTTQDEIAAEPAFQLPDGWTWYENKEFGFKFAYSEDWGTLLISKETSRENQTQMHFSKNTSYFVSINDKSIKNLGGDEIRNVIQKLVLDSNQKLKYVVGSEVLESSIEKLQVADEVCGYDLNDLSGFSDDPDNPGDIEQFVICSLANSSGVFILSHMQAPKETEKSTKAELTSIAKSFQAL
ncbi:hypothetical protein HYU82_00775 [Candidatus Saccharibacteria bacterium]|nr:hypothetical protein [Candidatus Saccharibacteria bacterium]